ncbi:MAG: hypothetical protein AAFN17_06880 [Pseudomonadota bacterium]
MARPRDFGEAIAALWKRLDLGTAPTGEEAVLRVDGRSLDLRPSPDGTGIRISAELGAVAPGGAGERDLERLLQRATGLLLTNAACLHFDPATRNVFAEGHADLDATPVAFDAMVDQVLDLAVIAPEGTRLESDFRQGVTRRPADDDDDFDNMLILRP